MLKVKEDHPLNLPREVDYELEDGTLLYRQDWNGEEYTVRSGRDETVYRPVSVHDEEQDTWETIGFEVWP